MQVVILKGVQIKQILEDKYLYQLELVQTYGVINYVDSVMNEIINEFLV